MNHINLSISFKFLTPKKPLFNIDSHYYAKGDVQLVRSVPKEVFPLTNLPSTANILTINLDMSFAKTNLHSHKFLHSSIDGNFDLSSDSTYKCKVYHSGKVEWFPGGIFRSGCRLQMTYFPFDRQVCNMTIESWAYNSQLLTIKRMNHVVDLQPSVGNGQWLIENTAISDMIFLLSELDGFWSKVEIQFHLQRKSGYYVMNIILPCVAISFLVLMVFHLPPDAGEKISLGVTVLLAFSVFQLLIADIMPRSSDSNPVIGTYMRVFRVFGAVITIINIFSQVYRTLETPHPRL